MCTFQKGNLLHKMYFIYAFLQSHLHEQLWQQVEFNRFEVRVFILLDWLAYQG